MRKLRQEDAGFRPALFTYRDTISNKQTCMHRHIIYNTWQRRLKLLIVISLGFTVGIWDGLYTSTQPPTP